MSRPFRRPSGQFFIRIRIPDELQAVAGKQLYSKPLGTDDPAEAQRRWPAAVAAYEGALREWRCAANRVSLTPDAAAELAVKWGVALATGAIPFAADRPEAFDTSGPGGTFASDTDRMRFEVQRELHAREALRLAEVSITPEGWAALLEAMTRPVLAAYLEAGLRAAGVSAAGGSPAFSPFTHPLEKHGAIVRAERPEPEPPPGAAPVAPSIAPVRPTPVVSFDTLLATWRRITAAKPRTVEATEYAVRDFKKFLGHSDAGRVTKADGLRWREDCLDRNLTNNTFNNRLSMVIQVLEVGVRDGLLPANPLAGLRLPKSKVALRHPYSDVDAVRILTAARKETSPALRWTHWIMAFTGMRVAEVLQLTQDDIRQDGATGLWYIAVHEADAGKSVKNGHARSIPIHPSLIQEGLLDYVKGIERGAPLFPDKKPDRYGQRGGRGWNLVGQWVRATVGITDTRVAPNHSWRHRMEDELRTAEVPEDVRDAILGHTRQTTGRLYGLRGEALSRLHRELSKVPMPKGLPSGLEECPLAA